LPVCCSRTSCNFGRFRSPRREDRAGSALSIPIDANDVGNGAPMAGKGQEGKQDSGVPILKGHRISSRGRIDLPADKKMRKLRREPAIDELGI
jgi:hypothetical protein